jgi:hypothetical protein
VLTVIQITIEKIGPYHPKMMIQLKKKRPHSYQNGSADWYERKCIYSQKVTINLKPTKDKFCSAEDGIVKNENKIQHRIKFQCLQT